MGNPLQLTYSDLFWQNTEYLYLHTTASILRFFEPCIAMYICNKTNKTHTFFINDLIQIWIIWTLGCSKNVEDNITELNH